MVNMWPNSVVSFSASPKKKLNEYILNCVSVGRSTAGHSSIPIHTIIYNIPPRRSFKWPNDFCATRQSVYVRANSIQFTKRIMKDRKKIQKQQTTSTRALNTKTTNENIQTIHTKPHYGLVLVADNIHIAGFCGWKCMCVCVVDCISCSGGQFQGGWVRCRGEIYASFGGFDRTLATSKWMRLHQCHRLGACAGNIPNKTISRTISYKQILHTNQLYACLCLTSKTTLNSEPLSPIFPTHKHNENVRQSTWCDYTIYDCNNIFSLAQYHMLCLSILRKSYIYFEAFVSVCLCVMWLRN